MASSSRSNDSVRQLASQIFCTKYEKSFVYVLRAKELAKKTVLRYMKYVLQAKRVLRAKELAKKTVLRYMKYVSQAKRVLRAKEEKRREEKR